jgi:hypothetical protein
MRKTWQAQNALDLLRDIQSDAQRAARGCIFGLKGDGVPLANWTIEQEHQADLVVQQLNTAAYLAEHRLVPARMLNDLWGDIFRRAYGAAHDRIDERRRLGDPDLWQSFTRVAEKLLKKAPATSFYPTSAVASQERTPSKPSA